MDKLSGPDWYGIFKDLHAGFILDLTSDEGAQKRYESAYKTDPSALRTVGLWPFPVPQRRQGRRAEGLSRLRQGSAEDPVPVNEEMKAIANGQKLPTLVDSPQAGAAEVSVLRSAAARISALIYLQLALLLSAVASDGAVVGSAISTKYIRYQGL